MDKYNNKVTRNIEKARMLYGDKAYICQTSVDIIEVRYFTNEEDRYSWGNEFNEEVRKDPSRGLDEIFDLLYGRFPDKISKDTVILLPHEELDYNVIFHKESDIIFIHTLSEDGTHVL